MPQRKNFLLKIKPGRRNYQKQIPGLISMKKLIE